MRISDWSADVCSSDLFRHRRAAGSGGRVQQWPVDSEPSADTGRAGPYQRRRRVAYGGLFNDQRLHEPVTHQVPATVRHPAFYARFPDRFPGADRSEEHTSELQSLMRISYAVFCLKKKKKLITRADRYQQK